MRKDSFAKRKEISAASPRGEVKQAKHALCRTLETKAEAKRRSCPEVCTIFVYQMPTFGPFRHASHPFSVACTWAFRFFDGGGFLIELASLSPVTREMLVLSESLLRGSGGGRLTFA